MMRKSSTFFLFRNLNRSLLVCIVSNFLVFVLTCSSFLLIYSVIRNYIRRRNFMKVKICLFVIMRKKIQVPSKQLLNCFFHFNNEIFTFNLFTIKVLYKLFTAVHTYEPSVSNDQYFCLQFLPIFSVRKALMTKLNLNSPIDRIKISTHMQIFFFE